MDDQLALAAIIEVDLLRRQKFLQNIAAEIGQRGQFGGMATAGARRTGAQEIE
jgi:hypothetical protein